jgi:hypothetical protein
MHQQQRALISVSNFYKYYLLKRGFDMVYHHIETSLLIETYFITSLSLPDTQRSESHW